MTIAEIILIVLTIVLVFQTFVLIILGIRTQPTEFKNHLLTSVVLSILIAANILGALIVSIISKPVIWVVLLFVSANGMAIFFYYDRLKYISKLRQLTDINLTLTKNNFEEDIRRNEINVDLSTIAYLHDALARADKNQAKEFLDYGLFYTCWVLQKHFSEKLNGMETFVSLFKVEPSGNFCVLSHTPNINHKVATNVAERMKCGEGRINGMTGLAATKRGSGKPELVYVPDLTKNEFADREYWIGGEEIGDVNGQKKGFFIGIPLLNDKKECEVVIDIFGNKSITFDQLSADDVSKLVDTFDIIIDLYNYYYKDIRMP